MLSDALIIEIIGFIVSIVTNEPSVMRSSVIVILPFVEFIPVIENVAFVLISFGMTVVVNVAVPPIISLFTVLPSKVPVKLPRSVLSVTRATVMFLLAFARLFPVEPVMFSEIIFIGYLSVTVTILVTLFPRFPAESSSAVYVYVWMVSFTKVSIGGSMTRV